MADLRKRFGNLTAAHRKRCGFTQETLAERAGVSVDMISKIEVGATGVSFATINRLSEALSIDPAELFSTEVPSGALRRPALIDLSARLAELSEAELRWLNGIVEAALRPRT